MQHATPNTAVVQVCINFCSAVVAAHMRRAGVSGEHADSGYAIDLPIQVILIRTPVLPCGPGEGTSATSESLASLQHIV